VPNSAQRAALVIERSIEEEDWLVVGYLVRDSGQRERKTLTRRPTRVEAAQALEGLWAKMLEKGQR
jgi:hypothetical protein